MKRIYLVILILFAFSAIANSQVTVTVTNPTNATPNLAASYPSLANAITALNAVTTFSGPVTLTCAAGNETAPAGGYEINFTAATSSAELIVITGTATTTITASAALTAGALNDAIFKIIGCDQVTIKNFTMQENVANTISAAATNNMTEFGVALFYATPIDGCNADSVINNIISLNRTYTNTFGIYSNTRATATAVTTLADGAPNLFNSFSDNTISNVNMGIALIGIAAAASHDLYNIIRGNTITNWGGAAAASAFVSNSPTSYCIYLNHQDWIAVFNNTITSATLSGTPTTVRGILLDYSVTPPTGVSPNSITNNTITITDNFTSGILECIRTQGITVPLVSQSITISDNTILNTSVGGAASSVTIVGISNSSAVYNLSITGNVIRGTTSTATLGGFTGILNTGNVGNSITIFDNHIGNASGGAITMSVASTEFIRGIYNQGAAPTLAINNNSIDGISCVTVGFLSCIQNSGAATGTIDIRNNQLGTVTGNLVTFSGVQANSLYGIFNSAGTSACTVTIQGNDVRGIVHSVTGNCSESLILQNASVLSANILNNTFTNLSINNGNSVFFIFSSNTMASGASFTCSNNSIVGTFNKPASGGQICFLISLGNSVNGSTLNVTDNNFSNVTLNGGGLEVLTDQNGISTTNGPTKIITGNIINNINVGNAYQANGIDVEYGVNINCSSNTISNISGASPIYGIAFISAIPQIGGNCTISSNTISGFNSTSGDVEAIWGGWYSTTNNFVSATIQNNIISNLSSSAPSALISGIDVGGITTTISGNVITGLSGSGTVSPSANGIIIRGGTTINVYKNDIHSITASGVISTTSPAVNGMLIPVASTVNVYNNFISDLKATGASLADAIRGISVTSTTASSTYNIYYNSVYLNASSTGTNFGTSGIYHTTSTTATTATLNMSDNIIANTSTANGTGVTVAYRRSDATLTNFASTSDYNLFYAGTPGTSRLIYYDGTTGDQTLSAYQTRVSTRDANSITVLPNFTSATDLHLTTANCQINNKGTPVAGITTDIDAAVRNVTTPDIGADEFTSSVNTTLAGVVGSAVCENRIVSGAGTTYISNDCDLIANILPTGGGTAVSGYINVCVTRQASVQTFNAEPYVTRHYDIEPTTSTSSTTATITLYFTDAEFVAYNAANGSFPDLPTQVLGNGDPNIANLRVTQYHGTATVSPSTPGNYSANAGNGFLIIPTTVNWNAASSRWEVTFPVTGFSGFYVHTNIYFPLAVNVNYLRGTKQGSNHLLNWKVTCNSTPSVTMTLERSASASGGFAGINTIFATAAQCAQPFNYTDAQPLKGMNYYRLKMVDATGKISYSSTVALLNATKGFELMNIAPNPITGNNFTLNVAAAKAGNMELVISDMQGRVVNKQTISLINGFNSITINVANLGAGTYNLFGTTADDKSRVIRFVKQ